MRCNGRSCSYDCLVLNLWAKVRRKTEKENLNGSFYGIVIGRLVESSYICSHK